MFHTVNTIRKRDAFQYEGYLPVILRYRSLVADFWVHNTGRLVRTRRKKAWRTCFKNDQNTVLREKLTHMLCNDELLCIQNLDFSFTSLEGFIIEYRFLYVHYFCTSILQCQDRQNLYTEATLIVYLPLIDWQPSRSVCGFECIISASNTVYEDF